MSRSTRRSRRKHGIILVAPLESQYSLVPLRRPKLLPQSARCRHRRRRLPASLAESVAVETLVEHLLAAKRSLSSMTSLVRANDLATAARAAHEETVTLSAQADFLRRGIGDQAMLLVRVRRGLQRAYDFGKRDFKQLVRRMDASEHQLRAMLDILRATQVEAVFQASADEPKSLVGLFG